jgi:transposase
MDMEGGMTEHIHKRLADEQVRTILQRYLKKEISAEKGMDLLGLKRRGFFKWVKRYKEQGEDFSIGCKRSNEHKRISEEVEQNILKELTTDKTLIEDFAMPVRFYNYSFIKDQLMKKYQQEVSLPTIIDRAKKKVFTSQDLKRNFMTER